MRMATALLLAALRTYTLGVPQARLDNSFIGDSGKEGSYHTRGYLTGYPGYYDRQYRGAARGGDTCPYENVESKVRKKREVEGKEEIERKEGKEGVVESVLLARVRRQLVGSDRYKEDWVTGREAREGWYGRFRGNPSYRDDPSYRDNPSYRDDRYRDTPSYRDTYRDTYRDDRYRDGYWDDRYRDDRYRDGYWDERYREERYRYEEGQWDGAYRGGRDRCGREQCTWEAALECDTTNLPRGYREEYVRWEREHDSYYPRDVYRDVLEYLGARGRLEGTTLIIDRLRPQDKGVYRCYIEGGQPGDFVEVHFYPKFPLDDNESC